MTGNLKFQAYQSAYFILGFNIQSLFVFAVGLGITWGIILPFSIPIVFIRDFWIDLLLNTALPSGGYVLVLMVFQQILCRFVILQDYTKNSAIDNRRTYHLCAYFLYMTVSCIYVSSRHISMIALI
jgi:hypothetical protein